ncbi:MAG: MopE-related protein [Byssovorax sp.]
MQRKRAILASLLVAAGSAGCNLVLGLDKFEEGSGGSGTTTSTTTTGTTQVCVPNTEIECVYHGPDSAKDHAPCKAGTQACKMDGSGYEACTGEVLPAATDTCDNNVDDDCNGMVDDGCVCKPNTTEECPYGGDPATKDHGPCHAAKHMCNADGKGFGACDGTEVLPAAKEICGNGVDDDCNGTADDGCPCTPGDMAPCYDGAMGTENMGACHGGMKTCNADGETYGPCVGQVLPAAMEDCSTPAVDEDCDGATQNGCLCVPGDTAPCYDGAAGTENVGLCHGGTKTCNADGLSYGACQGEVLPAAEVCAMKGDEDCNGHACSEAVWSKSFQSGQIQLSATDAQGNVFLFGTFNSSIAFEATTLISAGSNDLFLAKLGPQGQLIWAKKFGDGNNQNNANAIAVDGSGNVFIAATLIGTIDFGGGGLSTAQNGFAIAKLSGNGAHLWSKAYTSAANFYCRGIAADPNGDLIVAGDLNGSADLGAGSIVSAGAGDIFVAKLLKGTGVATWSKRFGDVNDQNVRGLAVDSGGSIYLAGVHSGTWNFGVGPNLTANGSDVYVAKLDGSGNWACSKTNDNGGAPEHLVVDSLGSMVLTGTYNAAVNFGGANLAVGGASDIYLAKFTTGCVHSWSKGFGAAGNDWNPTVTVDSNNNVILGAQTTGTIDFGGGALVANGAVYDVTLAKFSSAGAHQWSRIFGTAGLDIDASVAVGSGGSIFFSFDGTNNVDVGNGPLMGGIVVASFDP